MKSKISIPEIGRAYGFSLKKERCTADKNNRVQTVIGVKLLKEEEEPS